MSGIIWRAGIIGFGKMSNGHEVFGITPFFMRKGAAFSS
jgi:hypothetical protein